MSNIIIAPCGLICNLCLGFQRDKNTCVGCTLSGNKPYHCTVCSIKTCIEKKGNESLLCSQCIKFPCRRIKDLDKRYTSKYGESPIQNMKRINETGRETFVRSEQEKWKCVKCGHLLCVHKEVCLNCGANNEYFPKN